MDTKDSLGNRMKEYEMSCRHYLTRRVPVILRIDGKAFHSFTKGFERPFDDRVFLEAMRRMMQYLCENVHNCVFGYTQSDEITLVLVDYKRQDSAAWFDNCQNKIESVGASMATMAFNMFFAELVSERIKPVTPDELKRAEPYKSKMFTAMFDCRAFNIPKEEVCNNLIWRQQDASRNSIQQIAHFYFSQKELQGKNCDQIQEMLFDKHGINWSNLPTHLKRGSCCIRKPVFISKTDLPEKYQGALETDPQTGELGVIREKWVIDKEIPLFTADRKYVESRVEV